MPIRAMGGRPRSTPPEIDEVASRTMWPDKSDAQLAELRAQTQREKSEYRNANKYIRARALERINEFERRSVENRDRVLTGRLAMLGQPEDDPLAFSNGELTNLIWANADLFGRWRALLAKDQSVPWSALDLADFRSQLQTFDQQVEDIDRELALRAAKRRRLEAEQVEAALAAR